MRTKAVVISLATVVSLAQPALATTRITLDPCRTMVHSLYADWVATRNLIEKYGPQYEANAVIRAVGPNLYFPALIVVSVTMCRQNETWGIISIVVWAVQTWAVSTHEPFRTNTAGPPLLFVKIEF